MEAVQRMRKKAQDKGTLKSTEQQKVETKVVESKTVIVVEQANPEVVYVPSYNPVVVYGAPVYAYPPIYYPPTGYYAAGMAISFGVNSRIILRKSSYNSSRRRCMAFAAAVRMTPQASSSNSRSTVWPTTPYPVMAVPGSTPITTRSI